ncbi:amidase family protein [Microvirga massiliensis]|uniref:amidase family protein n=1 Tax=Microvirga massiliensis TaxID=1033741 RepID=UPI0006617C9D|nr:amidase family protein [Microvirga massiliensis]
MQPYSAPDRETSRGLRSGENFGYSSGMDILTLPAAALRDRLLRKELSPLELLSATLDRISMVNPILNAVVALDAERATTAARESEHRIDRGEARPLEGLVVTIKDSFDVAGLRSTAGAPIYRDRVPETDATAVARLRSAGAVILGKSNVPAFTADFQTNNPIFGASTNPHDTARSPGGSSGGAAAAIATGMSTFELGSDLGGSIRWPAHACGIYGLKTTWNLVPLWGHVPPVLQRRTPRNPDLMVAGPLTRSAADLALILPVLAGSGETSSAGASLAPPRRTRPKGLRVGLWLDEPFAPVAPAVSDAVPEAARRLEAAGAIVEPVRPVRFEEAFEIFSLLNHAIVAASLPAKVRDRLQQAAAGALPGDLSHRALQARGASMTPGLYQQVKARKQRMEALWARLFTRVDVVLCPPAPVQAIPHDHGPDVHARVLDIGGTARPYLDFLCWASPASSADLPAVSAPVTMTGGLPAGVQVIAARGEDLTAIAVAQMLEDLGCRYLPPRMLEDTQRARPAS